MNRRKTGILLIAVMCLFCTACGAKPEEVKEEVPTVRIMAWSAGHTNENRELDLVNEALGDLTEKKIGCRLELIYPSNTLDYRLILGSKERMESQVDIVGMYGGMYESYLKEGYLMKLDSYIEEYGDGILETLGCEMEELRIKGYQGEEGVYGIPKAMPEIHTKGVVVRRDLLEKYEFSLDGVKQIEDMEPFLECIAENEEISPIVPTAAMGGFFVNEGLDIVDSAGAIAVRKDQNSLKVENFFETPEFESYALMMKRWREKGILSNQIGREDELGLNLVVAGQAAAAELIIRPDEVEEWLGIYGDTIAIKGFDMKPFMTTKHKWRYNWFVNSECEYPELAVQALNLMYTDPGVNNLMLYGVEGVHYIVDKDGFFSYPEGVNQENVGYFTNEKWQFYRKIGGLWKGMSANQRQEMEEFNNSAVYSPIYGFILDETPIRKEIEQIGQVIEQFYYSVQLGFGDGESTLREFQKKLREAGIEHVKEEVKYQIEQWKA